MATVRLADAASSARPLETQRCPGAVSLFFASGQPSNFTHLA